MPPPAASQQNVHVPLCVDLDGTLIQTDLVWESLVRLLKRNPLYAIPVLFWWSKGRARLKAELAKRVAIDIAALPYNPSVLEFLRSEKESGRPVLLVTASDIQLAERVARHVGAFTGVLASDGRLNLRGKNKAAALAERFGPHGFDYAGNSSVDLPVWHQARQAIVVTNSESLANRAREVTTVARRFTARPSSIKTWMEALRPHQWVKNLILFVPLITAHKITQAPQLLEAVLAFCAFCMCASSVYIVNDLFDLDADRHHSVKRLRPFASGALPLVAGLAIAPVLLACSMALAAALSLRFVIVLSVYVILTTSYSWRLKQYALLDVFCLAALYTIRLIAGHEATSVAYSFWLLVFSMFIFLSLALVKRFLELDIARRQNQPEIRGRGYAAADLELVASLGANCGYLAVLVLALYVNSQEVLLLYRHPVLLLLICPLLLYWISRVWMIAHRGQMHDDPILFALKDRVSYIIGLLTLGVLLLATR